MRGKSSRHGIGQGTEFTRSVYNITKSISKEKQEKTLIPSMSLAFKQIAHSYKTTSVKQIQCIVARRKPKSIARIPKSSLGHTSILLINVKSRRCRDGPCAVKTDASNMDNSFVRPTLTTRPVNTTSP